jgi:asparagine synthase (glutamine-hydrolysing)
MCGIAGLFLPRGGPLVEANLDAMTGIMRHRGPDGEGTYVSSGGRYQAGFRRLAIIDLETGDQPIVEADGERVLMGNGEIYNYLELRRDLPNYPFQTRGDIEVVLPLAAAHGTGFVHRLSGMFALALFEARPHRLTLVRDRLGIKPLYWARAQGGGIVFASEIKAIFASGLIVPAVDEAAVSSYLSHGYVPAPGTLFAGINKLPPGCMLVQEGDANPVVSRYWRAEPARDLPQGADAMAEYFTDLLRDSVALHLRSDVPVGALLSGGLDSGLIVALAAQAADRPIQTFTVRFEGATIDESPLARAVAERAGAPHQILDLPAMGVGGQLPRLAWLSEEPLADAALLPNLLIEEAVGKHLKVVLNGTGGDELFAGYGRYFQLPVERRYLALPRGIRRALIEPLADMLSPMRAWQLARAEKFMSGEYLHDHSTSFPAPVRDLIGNRQPPPPPAQARYFAEFEGDAQSGALYADLNTYLPDDLLQLLDRSSMAAGVEGRVPFLDHRLVEAALAVPPEIRTPGGRQKGLERAMAERLLPRDVLDAPKQGFASPVPAWMEAGLGDQARRLLTHPRALERGWWTAAGIERLFSHPRRHGFRIYSLLMLELAVRVLIESPLTMTPPGGGLEDLADAA